jgi:hypothetical protein
MSEKGDLGFSPTVPWQGPATNKKREPMTGQQFDVLREKAASNQAAADTDLVSVLTNAGLPKIAAAAIKKELTALQAEIAELKVQLQLLRNLPPHLAKAERRNG